MLDHEDRDARPGAELPDVVEELEGQHRRHARHRLVEQDHPRLDHQGAAELQELPLSSGERTGVMIRQGAEPDELEDLQGALPDLALASGDPPRRQPAHPETLSGLVSGG